MQKSEITSDAFVEVRDLCKTFTLGSLHKSHVRAVDGVSFSIPKGQTLGLVGESGSGKSTLGRLVLGLTPATSGSVRLEGQETIGLSARQSRSMWRNMQMVFQDPYSSLNPKMTIRDALAEPLRNFGIATGAEADRIILRTIDACGLPAHVLTRYPREFSGGQRQRVGIARALILKPKFIIADEPVSALDVSIQAQIINMMEDLKAEFGLTYLFIAHDLAVVRHVSDQLAVMYRGKIVEIGPSSVIYAAPAHPYTQLLIRSIPIPDKALEAERLQRVRALRGAETAPPATAGCAFAPRCPFAKDLCRAEAPVLRPQPDGRSISCHFNVFAASAPAAATLPSFVQQ